MLLSQGIPGAGNTNAVYIRMLVSQRIVHWARKSRIRATGRWWLRSRAPADRLPHRKATAESHADRFSRESLRHCTISLRDSRSDNPPLVKRALEIVRRDTWSPAGKQCPAVRTQAIRTSGLAVCAAN